MSGVVKKVSTTRKVIKTSIENHKPKYINTWVGNEHLERLLIKLTKEYLSTSNSLLDECGGEELIHNTIAAMNENTHKIKENRVDASVLVSQKLVKLVNFSSKLIYKHNMSPTLVNDTKNKYIRE
ncbi:hypothetical protein RB653_001526 [Dictyostelium firmibasis]|uniref:Uncharacterized protein n=1 Tax=Dictyostelium firmibasis TaxID=79012 RepID=A0AAN7UGU9_9MYCE